MLNNKWHQEHVHHHLASAVSSSIFWQFLVSVPLCLVCSLCFPLFWILILVRQLTTFNSFFDEVIANITQYPYCFYLEIGPSIWLVILIFEQVLLAGSCGSTYVWFPALWFLYTCQLCVILFRITKIGKVFFVTYFFEFPSELFVLFITFVFFWVSASQFGLDFSVGCEESREYRAMTIITCLSQVLLQCVENCGATAESLVIFE